VLDRAAQALLAKETLDEAEIAALTTGLARPAAPQQGSSAAAAKA
jgi:hypothetical protein